MYLIPSKKLIYLAQPRTGSTSLSGWLIRNGLAERVQPSWPLPWGDHHGINYTILQEKKAKGWKSLTFVRNHWDYAVSFYFEHRRDRKVSFEHFLKKEFPALTWHVPQHTGLPRGMERWNTHGKLFWLLPQHATYTFRFEEFPANLVPLFGDEILELENVNPSQRDCYQAYYTDATRAWVERQYWREIQKYNYQYEPGENDGEEREAEPEPLGGTAGDDG